MKPRISVYIPSYNNEQYIASAIESVIHQTLQPYEIVIIDDCSADNSREIIKKYQKKYPDLIRVFFNEKNLGIAKVRNFALSQVRGDYITYLDGDDLWYPQKLELEFTTLLETGYKIVYSNYNIIDEKGNLLKVWDKFNQIPRGDLFDGIIVGNLFSSGDRKSIYRHEMFRNELVHKSVFKKVGNYDTKFEIYEDWDIRIRFAKYFEIGYCNKILSAYRDNPLGLSKANIEKHIKYTHYIKKKYKKQYYKFPLIKKYKIIFLYQLRISYLNHKLLRKKHYSLLFKSLLFLIYKILIK